MKLLSYQTTPRLITFALGHDTDAGEVKTITECREAPLVETEEALQALDQVVGEIMDAPDYWLSTVTIAGFSLSYTKLGTRSMVIRFSRLFNCSATPKTMTTPAVQIDNPSGAESEERKLSDSATKLVVEAISQAERYCRGERQQQRLPLDGPEPPAEVGVEPDEMDFS